MDSGRRTFPKKTQAVTKTGHGDKMKRARSSKIKQAADNAAKYQKQSRRALASKAKTRAPSGANSIPLGESPMMLPKKIEKKPPTDWHFRHNDGNDAEKTMVDYLSTYENEAYDEEEVDEDEHEEQEEEPEMEDGDITDQFREKIADMPLSEVMALRDKLGTKLYEKAVFGVDPTTSSAADDQASQVRKRKVFKREHAKRPREVSSKRRVSKFRNIFADQKLTKERFDPRFEEQCGEYDDFIFGQNYAFVKDIRSQEKNILKTEMQKLKGKNPEKAAQIKDIVTRIENQERSETLTERQKDRIRKLRGDNMERMRQGRNPFYMKKSELKKEELTEHYERLQNKGKLDKYLKRKTKKSLRRGPAEGDTQQLVFDDSE